jgi:hypothetical protein
MMACSRTLYKSCLYDELEENRLAALRDERSELIRQAFADAIAVLGERAGRALIDDLQRRGVHMQNLTLEKLAAALRPLVGDEAADIIMQDVIMKLDKLSNSKKVNGK